MPVAIGTEWIVDASGCHSEALQDLEVLRSIFAAVVRDLGLRPAAEPLWKVFDDTRGITGMVLLTESHLTVHTFPEHGHAAFNLYCCTPRAPFAWEAALARAIGARRVHVRCVDRAMSDPHDPSGGVRC